MLTTITKTCFSFIACIVTFRTMSMTHRSPGNTEIYVGGMQVTTEQAVAMLVAPLRGTQPHPRPMQPHPTINIHYTLVAQEQAQTKINLEQKAQKQTRIAQEQKQLAENQTRIAQEQACIAHTQAQEKKALMRIAEEQARTAHAQTLMAEEQARTAIALTRIMSYFEHPLAQPTETPQTPITHIKYKENNEESDESDTDGWLKV